MRGSQYLTEKLVTTDRESLNMAISYKLGNSLMWSGKGDGQKVVKTVEALAAFKALEEGTESNGVISETHIEAAIKEVVGDTSKRNDFTFIAPRGVEADDVDDWLDDLETVPMVSNLPPGDSLNIVQNAKPIYVGDNTYRFMSDGIMIVDSEGSPYTLKYMP